MVQVPVKFSATCKFNLYEREGIVTESTTATPINAGIVFIFRFSYN